MKLGLLIVLLHHGLRDFWITLHFKSKMISEPNGYTSVENIKCCLGCEFVQHAV
jgi:hypothetical protein